jgi:hypothetical protein
VEIKNDWQRFAASRWSLEELFFQILGFLPVTAAVEPTAAAVEPTAAARCEPAASITTVSVVAAAPAIVAAMAVVSAAAVIPVSAIIAATAVVTSSAIVAAAVKSATVEAPTVIAVVPGAGADEHATNEPVRPIVAVRRTGIRGIAVIAVGANRSWAYITVSRAHSNAH